MAFSSAVKIGDLNDFIAPSQACVVSLQGQKAPASSGGEKQPPKEGLQLNTRSSKRKPVKQLLDDTTALASPQPTADINKKKGFQQTVIDEETNAVKVSLNDCLACSGCVTSAETVLLQHQSLQEFVARCADPDAIVVVSISPQSRASLAALHGVTPEDVQWKLANFLKHQLSVALVLDTGLGSALALTEAAAEFVERYQHSHSHTNGISSSSNGLPNGSSSAGSDGTAAAAAAPAGPLPMLASACPGWVCYAEKTHGRYILPHISTTRSPQGIMGALVKRVMAAQKGWPVESIYHVTVMPCYDKKLEASRDDFLVPGSSVAEVDSCLTTGELQELLDKHGCTELEQLPGARPDNLLQLLQQGHWAQQQQQQQQQDGIQQVQQQQQQQQQRWQEPLMHSQLGSSGGYAQHIFVAAAQALFGVQLQAQHQPQQQLPFRTLRNADLQELQLLGPDGQPLLRFATAYGFRNIQTLVRKIKSGQCEYHYVEVMACPSGCLNGGGQLKPASGQKPAELVEQLELLFYRQQTAATGGCCGGSCGDGAACAAGIISSQQPPVNISPGVVQLLQQPPGNQELAGQSCAADVNDGSSSWLSWAVPSCASTAAVAGVYQALLEVSGGPGSPGVRGLLHTQYHHREKTVSSTISDW